MCLTLLWRAVCSPRLNTGQVTLWICFQSELLWLRQSVSQSESVPRTRLRSSWYSKQRDHHMTWKAKAFAHWEENGFFFILFHFYFGGIFIVSRINFRHFLLTHRNMKTWGGGKARAGGRKEKQRKEWEKGSFVWNGYYLPENISFEIRNYGFFIPFWKGSALTCRVCGSFTLSSCGDVQMSPLAWW